MECNRLLTLALWAGMLLCGLFLGCKEAKQVADLAKTVADPRAKGPMHERLKWKAEDFYTDPGVVQLCKAIEAKDVKEIERLVKSGVDVNAKGRGNMTPLLWAFPMGEDIFKKVLDLGADPNVKLTERLQGGFHKPGLSVMLATVSAPVSGAVHKQYFFDVPMDNYLRLVLEHGGDPNLEDASGETPVFDAVVYHPNIPEAIQLLKGAGADIDHRDHQGYTALSRTTGARFNSALALLKAGADYGIATPNGLDFVLVLERNRSEYNEQGRLSTWNDVYAWLTKEGVNWEAARAALKDQNLMKRLKNLPVDYQHRPWLPQRPTLKKADAKPEKM
jgi:uncharacterized protein